MRKLFLMLWIGMLSVTIQAQKIINNPEYISTNINGSVTKVELTDTETILHFNIKVPKGGWFSIPNQTYIESSEEGKRLFVVKADGTTLHRKHYMTDTDEARFKLYFPPLDKNVERINYGESNKGGNWFIYKLDITKDGKRFLNSAISGNLNKWNVVVGYPTQEAADANRNNSLAFSDPFGYNLRTNHTNMSGESLLPKDLPKDFFGSWYDKYGTLILITTPDYIVLDSRIQFYQNIQKISDTKFVIHSGSKSFEILNLDDDSMVIRTNKLSTLQKKTNQKNIPNYLKGKWLHWEGVKEITITDKYFYNNDKDYHGTHRDIVKSNIDYVAESNNGDLIWCVIYNGGNYHIYFVNKRDGEYVLQPRGFANARYQKVEN